MKKLDFVYFAKSGNVKWVFYILSLLILIVATTIASITDLSTNPLQRNLIFGLTVGLFIIGKLIAFIKKIKIDKKSVYELSVDIVVLAAIITYLVTGFSR